MRCARCNVVLPGTGALRCDRCGVAYCGPSCRDGSMVCKCCALWNCERFHQAAAAERAARCEAEAGIRALRAQVLAMWPHYWAGCTARGVQPSGMSIACDLAYRSFASGDTEVITGPRWPFRLLLERVSDSGQHVPL